MNDTSRPYAPGELPPDEMPAPILLRLPEPPLPAHRVALRAALLAPLAGFLAALAGVIAFVVAESRAPRIGELAAVLALATVGAAAWCALLVIGEEVARRVPVPLLRTPAIAV